jgi:undecaprenyl diphosphate synthase
MTFIQQLFKKTELKNENITLPNHIAIIMDGNGRWAKKKGLPRTIGHREGSNTLKKIVKACDKLGIKHLTVFAFSTENWKRPKNEVDALMSLLHNYLLNADKEIGGRNIRIQVFGDKKGLSDEIVNQIKRVTKSTAKNNGLTLNIALNYGSRDEIIHGVKGIAKEVAAGKLKVEDISEKMLSDRLYTAGIPDPDLLIRTSGEMRISNFLLWQLAYTEFWYTDVYWPDFNETHLMEAINEYQNRQRRFGGV